MRPISPSTGAHEVTFAEEQPDYLPLAVAVYPPNANETSPTYVIRWTFSAEERAKIAAGEDIYLSMLGGVAPHRVYAGVALWMTQT